MPELNKLGLPRPMTGAFASVYRLRHGNISFAVRCFLTPVSDQEDRYDQLSKYICGDDLVYTVGFQFIQSGIKIGQSRYPVLKMEWVEGPSLDNFVRKHHASKEKMSWLLALFARMSHELQRAGVAHGDLQHGNILVGDDDLRLVDYDGMYVPALSKYKSNELGHRNYQHPRRNAQHFGPYLDNFAAWVIWTSLTCLAEDSGLWQSLSGGDETLMFRQADFFFPDESPAFACLLEHDSEKVRNAAGILKCLLSYPLEYIPPLDENIAHAGQLPALPAGVFLPPLPPRAIDSYLGDVFSPGNISLLAQGDRNRDSHSRGGTSAGQNTPFSQRGSQTGSQKPLPQSSGNTVFNNSPQAQFAIIGPQLNYGVAPTAMQRLAAGVLNVRHLFEGFFQPPPPSVKVDWAEWISRADNLFKNGEYRKAAALYREAIDAAQEAGRPKDRAYLEVLIKIGYSYDRAGTQALSETYFRNARIIALAVDPSRLPLISIHLSLCLYRKHDAAGALAALKDSLSAPPLRFVPLHGAILSQLGLDRQLGDLICLFARDLKDHGDYSQAKDAYQCAIEAYQHSLGAESLQLAICMQEMASCAKEVGQTVGIRELYEKAMAIFARQEGQQGAHFIAAASDLCRHHLLEAKRYYKVANFWLARDKYLEALKCLETLPAGAVAEAELSYMTETVCAAAFKLPDPLPLLQQFRQIITTLQGTEQSGTGRIDETMQLISNYHKDPLKTQGKKSP